MQTYTYRSRPAGLTGPAYCDTSFVLDLFGYANPAATTGAGPATRQRIADAHAFYIWARLQGIDCYLSMFVLEEAYHKLLFAPILQHLQVTAHRGWKELRSNDAATFALLLTRGRAAVGAFQTFLRGSGTRLIGVGAGVFAGMLMREPRICRYARAILGRYEAEAMDAFHYALMRRCGIPLAFSSDRDWAAFPYGVLVTQA